MLKSKFLNKKVYSVLIICLVIFLVVIGIKVFKRYFPKSIIAKKLSISKIIKNEDLDAGGIDEDESVPLPVSASPTDIEQQSSDKSALGGYNILIADRGNNRLIEVTPEKKIVWEYKFDLPKLGLGADDVIFTDNGKNLIVNLEEYQIIQQIDYQAKKVTWEYGVPGVSGSADGYLNNPDDAYKMPNGNVVVADIKNCRVIEISPDKHIVRQYGQTKVCGNSKGLLNKPNGDLPLPNGHMLISNIRGHNLIELDEKWQPVFSMVFPLTYPSDPQPTKAGNILVADYVNPGKIIEISKDGKVVWEFTGEEGGIKLNKPSLAAELPNGNILANDDYNHRVIVIDKRTKKIIWQYGVTGKPGNGPDQLSVPDGFDIIKRDSAALNITDQLPLHTIGQITRHAKDFVGQNVKVSGYLIKKESGYSIFSDEATGAVSIFDLPVVGSGIDTVQPGKKYILEGKFVEGRLQSSGNNAYHLELSGISQIIQ